LGTVDRLRGWLPEQDTLASAIESGAVAARQLRWLRIAVLAEASTLLLLVCVAVPLKHLGDWPTAVRLLGPLHGFAFVAYVWLVFQSLGAGLLSRGEAVRLAAAAFVPMAGYFTARFLSHRNRERLIR
jgi:integral membrane protein